MYFNLICEELCITGGKVIHIDTNVGSLEEVYKIVTEYADKYPTENGNYILYNYRYNNTIKYKTL